MILADIELWHRKARPKPTAENFSVQLGCHLEEIAEMFEALELTNEFGADTSAHEAVKNLADALKAGKVQARIKDREAFLDSLADQIVTAIGVGWCAGMQTVMACSEVNDSNWSKFVNEKPVFNEQGKITKGPDYAPPNLKGLY